MGKFITPVFLMLTLSLWAGIVSGDTGTRLLQEVVSPDQHLEHMRGLPVIISQQRYNVMLVPQSILPEANTILYFDLVISNPGPDPLVFRLDQVAAVSAKKSLKILGIEEVVAEKRRFYSRKEYKISAEEEKLLAPFVEQKMQMVRDKLLTDRVIAPNSRSGGTIAVAVPFGTQDFAIEVDLGDERHKFEFNLVEFPP